MGELIRQLSNYTTDRLIEIDTLERKLEASRQALQKYGRHLIQCDNPWRDRDASCNCGFEAILAGKETP